MGWWLLQLSDKILCVSGAWNIEGLGKVLVCDKAWNAAYIQECQGILNYNVYSLLDKHTQ